MHTVKIVTTDKKTLKWKSLGKKIETISLVLNTVSRGMFRVSIEHRDLTPEVVNGRITHDWFDKTFGWTTDFVVLHMSKAQAKKWGIKTSLRGSNLVDKDDVGEMYIIADEDTKRGPFNQFVQTILHEIRHEICRGIGLKDDTHELHGQDKDISPHFAVFDMTKYRKDRQEKVNWFRQFFINWIRQQQPATLHKRLPDPYNNYISQDYGVKNSVYKLTGRHIGIDYACPVNTPVYAPWDGEVTVSGNSAELGNFCHYTYVWEGKSRVERFLHLNSIPEQGKYKRGETVAYSGNSGFSTGPHLHVDAWWKEVQIGSVNKNNWNTLTYNPHID